MSKPHENYALVQLLGTGGQAEVFKARDKRTNAIVAFKRLLHQLRTDEEAKARLRYEIDVQTAMHHRNIMPVLDHSHLFQWYVMPLGSTTLGTLSTPVDDGLLFQVICDCANGLLTAHEKGYIHRDITPNNIILLNDNGDSRWVVSDWGLVRRHGQTTVVRTAPSQSFGTAGFAAPEMWGDAHGVGESADVYSLGRVVYFCLTGRWPPPYVPLLPGGKWDEFVGPTTELDQGRRIQDMEGVLELLKKMKAPIEPEKKLADRLNLLKFPGMTGVDAEILEAMCTVSLKIGVDWVSIDQIEYVKEQSGISDEEFFESIEILADKLYIQGDRTIGDGMDFFQITTLGFEQYATIYLPEYNNLLAQVLLAIVDRDLLENNAIAEDLKQLPILIDYALDSLARRNWITISKTIGGGVFVGDISAQGRRTARGLRQ